MEEASRVLEHDSRLLAVLDQLGNELPHALVAPMEDGGVVVVADVLVIHHVLEIADYLRRARIVASGGNQGLLHVKSVGEEAPGAVEIDATLGQVDRPRPGDSLGDDVLRAAEVGEVTDVLGKRLGVHGVASS